MAQNSCESCTYYTYDEDYESYMCDINMDEDEYMRLISDQHYQCPYYRFFVTLSQLHRFIFHFLCIFQ